MADLLVDAIHTAYGLSRVLFGVSLEVHAGECIALIGRNGVGKTTTMRSIIGLTPPMRGRVVWKGRDISELGPHGPAPPAGPQKLSARPSATILWSGRPISRHSARASSSTGRPPSPLNIET